MMNNAEETNERHTERPKARSLAFALVCFVFWGLILVGGLGAQTLQEILSGKFDDPKNGRIFVGGKYGYVNFDTSKLRKNLSPLIFIDRTAIPIRRAQIVYFPGVGNQLSLTNVGTGKPFDTSTDRLFHETDPSMVKAEVENSPNTYQILVAHSQGGMRALAYAHLLNRLGYGDRILGIVLIGTPTIGQPLIVGGREAAVARIEARIDDEIDSILDTIEDNGYVATANSLAYFADFLVSIKDLFSGHGWDVPSSSLHSYLKHLAKRLGNQAKESLNDALDQIPIGPDTIADMDPNGDFCRYLLGVDDSGFRGDRFDTISRRVLPILPLSTRVAFVVGTHESIWEFLGPTTLNTIAEYRDEALDIADLVDSKIVLGLYLGDLVVGQTTIRPFHDIASKLRSVTKKYLTPEGLQDRWGELLFDSANDGFIPVFAQSRTLNETGGRSMLASGYIFEVDTSHAGPASINEYHHPYIWGTSLGFGTPLRVSDGGLLASFLQESANNGETKSRTMWRIANGRFLDKYF